MCMDKGAFSGKEILHLCLIDDEVKTRVGNSASNTSYKSYCSAVLVICSGTEWYVSASIN